MELELNIPDDELEIAVAKGHLRAFGQYATPAWDWEPAHWKLIAQKLMAVERGEIKRLMIFSPPRHGKLASHDTLVPTPDGWKRHGDLRVGDRVYHPSGKTIRVVALSDEDYATTRVTMSDGATIDVHPNHEWTLYDRKSCKWRTVETGYLLTQKIREGTKGRSRFQLPFSETLVGDYADLPLDPYTLGVWLGNGSTTKNAVTHNVEDELTIPYEISSRQVHQDTGVITTYYKGLWTDLKKTGVAGNKHIPDMYLWAHEEARWDLLCGLMDTDGSVDKNGRVRFVNTNKNMIDGIMTLIRSFGYRANLFTQEVSHRDRKIQQRKVCYTVSYSPHDGKLPFRLKRKQERVVGNSVRRRIGIVSVNPIDPKLGRCIQVDSPDGLYLVGEHMTPTHNSELGTIHFPAWYLMRNPHRRVIIASYAANLAYTFSRRIRALVREFGKQLFDVELDPQSSKVDEWDLHGHHGKFIAAGVGGPITGQGAGLFIIDDPFKNAEEANSPVVRQKVWDWYTSTAYTRLEPDGAVVITLTRWHDDDLAGRLLKEMQNGGEQWEILQLPAIYDEDAQKLGIDPLGRSVGESLWPSRFDVQALRRIQTAVGSYVWSALYQQRPQDLAGGGFKAHWFKWYTRNEISFDGENWFFRGETMKLFQGVDPAISEKTESDDFVIFTAGITETHKIIVLDVFYDHLDFPEQVKTIIRKYQEWLPERVGIEINAYQRALKQQVVRDALIPVKQLDHRGDKFTRIMSMTPFFENGQIYLRMALDDEAGFVDQARLPQIKIHAKMKRLYEQAVTYSAKATHDDLLDAFQNIFDTAKPKMSQNEYYV